MFRAVSITLFLNAPVTAVQKAEFINLANLLGPEKKAVLLIVMAKPTFSKETAWLRCVYVHFACCYDIDMFV